MVSDEGDLEGIIFYSISLEDGRPADVSRVMS